MPAVVVTDLLGNTEALDARPGVTLMSLLHGQGMVDAVCGGGASCGTCAVLIEAPWRQRLPPPGDAERQLLQGLDHDRDGSRLSCQVLIDDAMDGIRLRVLPPA